ncbi:Hypothetical predicted protein [Marmota monax]|uniref:Uncharacterized protein n=1 Tax=Marmota monax TaxID=9995 RepID=A0A5E4AV80_MARMO|nr:hypothetical protein GHT09_010911 [Marmota monax]VTJ61308.1 Hypothetical predicted protein [Marmota monax]
MAEDPFPLKPPVKCNNPRQYSGRIPVVTEQRAATPLGRSRVGTAGRSSRSPTARPKVSAAAALQTTRSYSPPAPRTHERARGRPRGGGKVVGGPPPRRSHFQSPPTWPAAAVKTGVPGSRTVDRLRSRRRRRASERAGPGAGGPGREPAVSRS